MDGFYGPRFHEYRALIPSTAEPEPESEEALHPSDLSFLEKAILPTLHQSTVQIRSLRLNIKYSSPELFLLLASKLPKLEELFIEAYFVTHEVIPILFRTNPADCDGRRGDVSDVAGRGYLESHLHHTYLPAVGWSWLMKTMGRLTSLKSFEYVFERAQIEQVRDEEEMWREIECESPPWDTSRMPNLSSVLIGRKMIEKSSNGQWTASLQPFPVYFPPHNSSTTMDGQRRRRYE